MANTARTRELEAMLRERYALDDEHEAIGHADHVEGCPACDDARAAAAQWGSE